MDTHKEIFYQKSFTSNLSFLFLIIFSEDREEFVKRISNKTFGPPPKLSITKRNPDADYNVDNLQKLNRTLIPDFGSSD